jgi:hypothetical protein
MLTMRDHNVEDYEALPDMDATDVGELREDDRVCLEELGRYLASTDAWQRFGIWLLHKHFHPLPGEVFVERASRATRTTQTAPMARSAFAADGLSTSAIRFEKPDDGVDIIGMEFAEIGDFGDTSPFSDDDEAILTGICERLAAHDKTHRFGVRLIRNPLDLAQDEQLRETCDLAGRTLNCTVGTHDPLSDEPDLIQTMWRWRVVHGDTDAIVMQECSVGCVKVGEGHDIAHTASGTDDFDNPTEGDPSLPF